MDRLHQRYGTNLALMVDLYSYKKSYALWSSGRYRDEAIFNCYYFKNPIGGDYLIACGIQDLTDIIKEFSFDNEVILWLASMKGEDGLTLFDESFLNYLQRMKFACDVDAVSEGNILFPGEPLLRIKGPIIQISLLESLIVNVLNFQTLIATKASRIKEAAGNSLLMELEICRSQGVDRTISISRATFIGGVDFSSNLLAGKIFGIPVKVAKPYSFVIAYDTELEAFQSISEVELDNCLLPVDSFNSIESIKNAIIVAKSLRVKGYNLMGIHLDKGELVELSILFRKMLDAEGFNTVNIMASGDIDEHSISELNRKGAKIDIWGIGNKLIVTDDQENMGMVFKMSAMKKYKSQWETKVNEADSELKKTLQGLIQIRRYYDNNIPIHDILINEFENNEISDYFGCEDLLKPIFRYGKFVGSEESIHDKRNRCLSQVNLFKKVFFPSFRVIRN